MVKPKHFMREGNILFWVFCGGFFGGGWVFLGGGGESFLVCGFVLFFNIDKA